MKNDFKKQQIIKKALDALQKQALRDEESKLLKGGGGDILGGGHGQTQGMYNH